MAPDLNRRQFLGAGASLLGMAALAACGSSKGSSPGRSSGSSNTSASSGASGSAAGVAGSASSGLNAFLKAAGKKYAGTSINVLGITSAQATAIRAIASDFESLTGIKVAFSLLSENGTITKASVSLDAKSSAYDVYQIESFFIPQYASKNYFVTVDDLKSRSDITYDALDLSAYAPASTAQLTFGGKLLALPMFVATQVMYYRTDLFKSAGVNSVPTTLQQLESVCKQIHGAGQPAIAYRTGIGPTENVFPWTAWLYDLGGGYYKQYDANTGKYSGPNLSASSSIAAGQLYIDIITKYGPSGALNWAVADVTKAFLSGQIAIMQEGSPFGGTVNDPKTSAVAGKVGAFAVPAGPAGSFYPSASQGWGISSYSKHQEAAWLFSQWATAPETQLKATLATPFSAPPTTATYSDSSFVKKYNFTGFLDALKTSYGAAKSSPIGGPYIPALSNWQAAGQQVSTYFNEAINGQKSVADAFAAADKALQQYA